MSDSLSDSPSRTASSARRRRRRGLSSLRLLGQTGAFLLFAGAIYLSGRLGVDMARNRLTRERPELALPAASETFQAGRADDPVYLAPSPETLRRFFATHPTPEDRASANLGRFGIRRFQDTLELSTLGTEADTVQVKVNSGALAGAVYWMHHSQIPTGTGFDPIISPVPGAPVQ